jgi:hypothetical protein
MQGKVEFVPADQGWRKCENCGREYKALDLADSSPYCSVECEREQAEKAEESR